jgi:hypothetical protein
VARSADHASQQTNQAVTDENSVVFWTAQQ